MALNEFVGIKYKLSESENFDEYLKAIGVGFLTRKIINSVSPIFELIIEDDYYTLKFTSSFKVIETKFKLGEEFDTTTQDGKKVKAIFTVEGNKLIDHQKGEKETSTTREFTKDEVIMTLKVNDVVCKRVYKAIG